MIKMYDPDNWREDLNECVQVREVDGLLLAIFHVVQGYDQSRVYNPPIDPEVGITKIALENRIRKREAARRNVDEDKKALQAIQDYCREHQRRYSD